MKNIKIEVMIFSCIALFFTGCHRSENPQNVASSFIRNISTLDFDNAEKLITDDSKKDFSVSKLQVLNDTDVYQTVLQVTKKNSSDSIKRLIKLDSLTVLEQKDYSKVFNTLFELTLKKEGSEWKVVSTENLINDILYTVSGKKELYSKFSLLVTQYDRKRQLIGDIIYLLKKSKVGNFQFFNIDSMLLINPSISKTYLQKDLASYINAQSLLGETFRKLLLQINSNSELAKSRAIDSLRLDIEVQDSRILLLTHEYNEFAKSVNPAYCISPSLLLSSEERDKVEF